MSVGRATFVLVEEPDELDDFDPDAEPEVPVDVEEQAVSAASGSAQSARAMTAVRGRDMGDPFDFLQPSRAGVMRA